MARHDFEDRGAKRSTGRRRIAAAVTAVRFRNDFRIAKFSEHTDKLRSQQSVVRLLARGRTPGEALQDRTKPGGSKVGETFLAGSVAIVRVVGFGQDGCGGTRVRCWRRRNGLDQIERD